MLDFVPLARPGGEVEHVKGESGPRALELHFHRRTRGLLLPPA